MARIVEFEPAKMDRMRLHDEVSAKIYFQNVDGRVLMQMSTFGRDTREMPGKLSQTIQLDREAAHQLYAMMKKEFGFQ